MAPAAHSPCWLRALVAVSFLVLALSATLVTARPLEQTDGRADALAPSTAGQAMSSSSADYGSSVMSVLFGGRPATDLSTAVPSIPSSGSEYSSSVMSALFGGKPATGLSTAVPSFGSEYGSSVMSALFGGRETSSSTPSLNTTVRRSTIRPTEGHRWNISMTTVAANMSAPSAGIARVTPARTTSLGMARMNQTGSYAPMPISTAVSSSLSSSMVSWSSNSSRVCALMPPVRMSVSTVVMTMTASAARVSAGSPTVTVSVSTSTVTVRVGVSTVTVSAGVSTIVRTTTAPASTVTVSKTAQRPATSTLPPLKREEWTAIAKKGPKYHTRDKNDKEGEKKHKRGVAILGASIASSVGGMGAGIFGGMLWSKLTATQAPTFMKNLDKLDKLPPQERQTMENTLKSIDQWANDLVHYAYEHPGEVDLDYLNVMAIVGVTPNYNLDSEFQATYRQGVEPDGWVLPEGVNLHLLDIARGDEVPPKAGEGSDYGDADDYVEPLRPHAPRPPGAAKCPELPTIPEGIEPAATPIPTVTQVMTQTMTRTMTQTATHTITEIIPSKHHGHHHKASNFCQSSRERVHWLHWIGQRLFCDYREMNLPPAENTPP